MDKSTGTISIAMEFCEGGSLDSIYKEVKKLGGRTGEKVLGKVAEGVLNGLTYLHSRKIIHRGMFNLLIMINSTHALTRMQISNRRIFFCAATDRSSYVILALVESSAPRAMPIRSLALPTTWPPNGSLVNLIRLRRTSGL